MGIHYGDLNMPVRVDFYSFFSKYSLVDDYGLCSGIARRLFEKVLPDAPAEDSFEHLIIQRENALEAVCDRLGTDQTFRHEVETQLAQSVVSLCSKLAAYGMDRKFVEQLSLLELDDEPFLRVSRLAIQLSDGPRDLPAQLRSSLEDVDNLINDFRKRKHQVGTTIHQTMISRRLLEYSQRVRELLELRDDLQSKRRWQSLIEDFKCHRIQGRSVFRHVQRHTDLLALAIVENTSQTGEKYIANDPQQYCTFLRRAALGGGVIVVFAWLKLLLGTLDWDEHSLGLLFGWNYAVCFIVVSVCGGIIATKQPAMTASTLAEFVDRKNELCVDSVQRVVDLVRTVFRSQFISIVGNFCSALVLSFLVVFLMRTCGLVGYTEQAIQPGYLIKNVTPSIQLLFFAGVAGVLLSLSGLVSGFIDNKVVAMSIPNRIRHQRYFPFRERLGTWCAKYSGMVVGNVVLGLLLGTTFLFSKVLPFDVDIRHIAFSTANIGFAFAVEPLSLADLVIAVFGALLVGLINLIISFSLTLWIALKSRGGHLRLLASVLVGVCIDFLKRPLHYLILFGQGSQVNDLEN